MSTKPLSNYEADPQVYDDFISGYSSRMKITGEGAPANIEITYMDFSTMGYCWRIFVFYSPYGGIAPWPSEPLLYDGRMPNYGHRLISLFDESYGLTGPTPDSFNGGRDDPTHWMQGWHVFGEVFDPVVGWYPSRMFGFNYPGQYAPSPYVDYAMMYFSPVNVNVGQVGIGPIDTPTYHANASQIQGAPYGSAVIQKPAQGQNQRQNNSHGGAWNEAGTSSPTRSVENDTTWSREFFFMANFLFDPDGDVGGNSFDPQQGVHNLISPDTQPAFAHALTVKPRYMFGKWEDITELRGLPMPHGVVMSCWVRDIPNEIGVAPFRSRTVSPIQNTYNSSSLSLVVKGGNYTPAHVQAF